MNKLSLSNCQTLTSYTTHLKLNLKNRTTNHQLRKPMAKLKKWSRVSHGLICKKIRSCMMHSMALNSKISLSSAKSTESFSISTQFKSSICSKEKLLNLLRNSLMCIERFNHDPTWWSSNQQGNKWPTNLRDNLDNQSQSSWFRVSLALAKAGLPTQLPNF